jgi:transcriptional regulator with XRE-family HTH domain
MISMASATRLRELRESLGVTQEQFARRARSLNLRTYIRAEQGRQSVKYDTAQQILETMNDLLREAGRAEVTLADLGLTIY